MSSPINLTDLGRRVRAVRLARKLTLEEVVTRANFTVSWLSKLENGQLTPSLEGLVKLAEVLECGVDTLVQGLSVPPQYVVVKRGEGRTDPARDGRGGYVTESLADQWRDRAMNPVIVHLSGVGNRQHPDNHDGERFLLVLEGNVRLEYGDELIHLDVGDSVYIYAAIPHVLAPAGRGTAKVLSVSYDPMPTAGHGRGAGIAMNAETGDAHGARGDGARGNSLRSATPGTGTDGRRRKSAGTKEKRRP